MSEFAPTRVELDNGLTVVHQANDASPAVVASLSVAAGAVLETASAGGLAGLTAAALKRGTESRTKRDIGEILDFRGAHLRTSAGRHSASAVAKMRAVDAPTMLELMADCVRRPNFPAGEIDKLRRSRLSNLREDLDDPDTMAADAFRELVFPAGHPYSWPVRGTLESVEALAAEHLRTFHAEHYAPSAALLVVAGAIGADDAVRLAREHFGDWQGPERGGYREAHGEISDPPSTEPGERLVDMPDKAQVSLLVGHHGIRRDHPHYYAAMLMNAVLGRFAMGGRLGRTVREEGGMAYYTYSAFGAGLGAGPFQVRAGVQPHHLRAAIAAIREQIERMHAEGVDAAELDDACQAAVNSMPAALESNEGLARMLHRIELFDLGADFPDRHRELLEAVTTDQASAVARELLHPDRLAVAAAGPVAASTGP